MPPRLQIAPKCDISITTFNNDYLITWFLPFSKTHKVQLKWCEFLRQNELNKSEQYIFACRKKTWNRRKPIKLKTVQKYFFLIFYQGAMLFRTSCFSRAVWSRLSRVACRGVHGNGNSHSHGIPTGTEVDLGYWWEWECEWENSNGNGNSIFYRWKIKFPPAVWTLCRQTFKVPINKLIDW